MIAITVAVIAILTVWAFTRSQAAASMTWAMRGGLIALNVSMVAGIVMIIQGVSQMAAGFIPQTTFGQAGIMKVPHAVGMHGIQVLPGLAWLLAFSGWPEPRRTRLVQQAAAGYLGLVAVSVLQTYSGLAPWDLTLLTAILLLASLVPLAVGFAGAITSLQQQHQPRPIR